MDSKRRLRIGVIAPPWLAVPPPSYGGTELVIDVLCRGLQDRGHRVELFTLGSSTCDVPSHWLYEQGDPEGMGTIVPELRHTAAAYDTFAACDIVHDHTIGGLFVAALHPGLPAVTTNHAPFSEDLIDLYRRRSRDVPVIAISHDQASRSGTVPIGAVIHHGLDLNRYPVGRGGGGYLVALGRMSPDKGVHTAIEVARRLGIDLAIGAKMCEPGEHRYFQEVIRPQLGNGVEYLGEIGHEEKVALLGGAMALVNPIEWPEPFGLVMVEALACGTPVVAAGAGAAPEIVVPGDCGFLASDVTGLVEAVTRVGTIDRARCRLRVEEHFSMERMAVDHERFYRSVIQRMAAVPARPSTLTPRSSAVMEASTPPRATPPMRRAPAP
jgi:glycosyltransferase involved in cell wall biosynthesis